MPSNNNHNHNPSGYSKLEYTWIPQTKYNLATDKGIRENFGAFSISAAVRPSTCYSCNKQYANPWYRGEQIMNGVN